MGNSDNMLKSSMNIMTVGIVVTTVSAIIVSLIEYYQLVSSTNQLMYFA